VLSVVLVFGGVGDDGQPLAALEMFRVFLNTVVLAYEAGSNSKLFGNVIDYTHRSLRVMF